MFSNRCSVACAKTNVGIHYTGNCNCAA